jgi:hypothetical protein
VPLPTVSSPSFLSSGSNYPLSISINKNTIVWTNVNCIPALTSFSITIDGIKMPNTTLISTNNFSIEVIKNNELVSYFQYFDTIYYSSSFSSDTMSANLYI